MGLRPGDESGRLQGLLIAWLPAILLLLAALVLAIFGDTSRNAFSYDRAAIQAGEYYRLVSAHLVHLGPGHMLLNVAGLVLVWFLVGASLSLTHWGIVIIVSIATIDAGFYWLMPELAWYVGLSGLLHGLLVAGIVASWRQRRPEILVLSALLAAKLAWEALIGPVPGSGSAAGGEVITEAHVYGAAGGLLAAALGLIRVRAKASI